MTPPTPTTEQTKKRSEKRQRQSMLAVRLLPAEHDQVRAEADRRGLTISELARRLVLQDLSAQ